MSDWNDPLMVIGGQIIEASDWNTYVSGNLSALRQGKISAGGSSNGEAFAGGIISASATQQGNVGASEMTLHQHTVDPGLLQTNGQTAILHAWGGLVGGGVNKRVRVRVVNVGNVAVLDTGVITNVGGFHLVVSVTRTGIASQRSGSLFVCDGETSDVDVVDTAESTLSGFDINITGEGASDGAVIVYQSFLEWRQAA